MGKEFGLINIQRQMMVENAKNEVRVCNSISEKFGLTLSEKEITELVECRAEALKETERIEFGGGILPKLVYAFCDSPYINQDNYQSTLAGLQEAFYYFKNESWDRLSDDELIEYMEKVFNGRAGGSVEYLLGTSLTALCRYARNEYNPRDAKKAGDLF